MKQVIVEAQNEVDVWYEADGVLITENQWPDDSESVWIPIDKVDALIAALKEISDHAKG